MAHRDDEGKRVKFGAGLINDGPQQQRNDAVISTQELGGSSSSENHGASSSSSSSSSYQMPPYPQNERRKMLFRFGLIGYRPVCIAYRTGRQCRSADKCPFPHEMPKNPISHRPFDLEAGNMGPLKPPEDQSVKTLYILRLNSSVLEQDIRDHFCPYGEIESIRFFDQAGVTCALLTYTTRQAAEKAMLELSASLVDINGQNLQLLWGPNQDSCNHFWARRALLLQQQRMDPQRNDAVISTQEVGRENHGASSSSSSYQMPPYPQNKRRKMLFRFGLTGSRRYQPVCIPYETGRQCTSGDKCPFLHENPIPHRRSASKDDAVRLAELVEMAGNMPLKPPVDQSVKTLCIRRLNSSVLEQDIRDYFCTYGEIESIRFFVQREVTCAFLTYTTRQAAEKATLERSSWVDINGQRLKLLWGSDQDTCNRTLARSALLPQQQRTQELGGSSSNTDLVIKLGYSLEKL